MQSKMCVIRYDARGAWILADRTGTVLAQHQALERCSTKASEIPLHPRQQECQERFRCLIAAVQRAEQLASEYSQTEG